MAYPPGSFTKNFAWHGKGFSKLHEAIRAGFSGTLVPVTRSDWRTKSHLEAGDFYLAANFFLFNIIKGNTNVIPLDELVYQAVSEKHSAAFDRLALFALNLSFGGKRTGTTNGMEFPTLWANEFVRELLWKAGRWERDALNIEAMDTFFYGRIEGVGRIKCRMNYRHLFELTHFLPAPHPQINTDAESWAAPALFLAWDRRQLAGGATLVTANDLIAQSVGEEDFRLLGLTQAEFEAMAAPIAVRYAEVGGIDRFTPLAKPMPGPPTAVAKPPNSRRAIPPLNSDDLGWLTLAGAEGAVERQIQQRLAQRRNQITAVKLKALYGHRCMACDVQILVGLSPKRFYAEAAHIRPLGKPHNGPDTPANMLVLCPNHHLQFDRGVLSIRMKAGNPIFVSRIAGDPVKCKLISLHTVHLLDGSHLQWHYEYFRKLPTS